MKNLVIFGNSQIAKLAHYYFSQEKKYKVVAFTVDKKYLKEEKYLGLPVIPFESVEEKYPPDKHDMFIAISYVRMNKLRAEKYTEAKRKGYGLSSYISPYATIFDNVELGDNCFILEGNVVQPFVKIGNNVTLWSGNHIGHDVVIEDHSFISSHVVISGNTVIKPHCFIGVNATLRNSIIIAPYTLIGAGATIMEDTVEKGVYVPPRSILLDKKSDEIKI